MKRLLLLFATIFVSTALFACTPKSPVEKLTKLADKVEKEHKSFDDEDWEKVAKEYAKLNAEFEKDEYTSEEFKEFGRQKGRIKGYMTKKTLKKWLLLLLLKKVILKQKYFHMLKIEFYGY